MLAAISTISSEGLVTPHAVTLGSAWHPKLDKQEGFLACFCSLHLFLPLSLPHSYSVSILVTLGFSDPSLPAASPHKHPAAGLVHASHRKGRLH